MRALFASALSVLVVGGVFLACSGEDGEPGPQGPAGVPGATGPTGPTGPAGSATLPDAGPDAAMTGCTAPCHGFGNVVDQWKFSGHYKVSALADEEPIWTSTATCGNCHAVDGLERRVAGTVTVADGGTSSEITKGHLNYKTATNTAAEAVYSGFGKNAIVHCTTCHAFTPTNDPHNTGKYLPGSAPLRVASGPDDQTFIEKSPDNTAVVGQPAGKYKAGNTCVMCHKSRKDITFYITTANKIGSATWGPHEGPQADVYSGKGGYHFAGATYGTSPHTTVANGCVSCHMPGVATNGNTPDHSMTPGITFCKSCHTTYTGSNYDIQSGQSTVRAGLKELQAVLNGRGLLTRSEAAPYQPLTATQMTDGAYELDKTRPGSGVSGDGGVADQVLDGPTAGALYNYLIIARGKDHGVHNPTYTKQLLWDSIKQLTGANPSFMSGRAP
jgi:hypothetical protein